MDSRSINSIEKFNPYHDRLGRFTTGGAATSFTFRTRSRLMQGAADKAIEREKQKHKDVMPTAAQSKTLKGIETRTRNLKKEQLRVVDREGNVIFTKQGDKNSVSYKTGEARDNFPGNITIHNHPEGGTFSSADLSSIGYGATEIRAASPEGTYILRNLRSNTKWVDGQKSWYEMKQDLEMAEFDFKSGISLRNEVRKQFSKETTNLDNMARKVLDARSNGDNEAANKYYAEYEKASVDLKKAVTAATRKAYTNQYHEWYKTNSYKYGLEYEFVPIRTKAKKSFYEGETMGTTFKEMIQKSGDIELDGKMNRDIEDLSNSIMDEMMQSSESIISGRTAKSFSDIEKFNPYHDRLGRFTTSGGATSFTYSPGKSKAHDNAIAREKERAANASNPGKAFGLSQEQHEKLEHLVNSSVFAAGKYRNEIGMDDNTYQKYKDKFKTKERRDEIRQERQKKEAEAKRTAEQELKDRIKNELPGLNQDAIRRADDNSMMGTAGSVRAKEALQRVDQFKENFKDNPDWTDEQRSYVQQRTKEYTSLVTEYYNDQIRRTGENVSWAVAGPANYNVRASQKKLNAQMNKLNEYEQKLSNFKENTQKKLKSMDPEDKQISYWRNGKWKHGETIDASDPLAEKKLTAKLEYHQEQQQKMKDANAHYRKNGTMEGFEGFSESTNKKIDAQMKQYKEKGWNYLTGKPFQSATLTNNNASIKATQARLNQIKANKEKASSTNGSGATRQFNGGSVIRNAEANRLQIKFDSIPDAGTRQKLKSNGWRWSPKNGVWQRQLTDNAERSANSLLDGLEKSFPEEKEEDDFFSVTKADDDKRLVFGWANVSTRANGEVIQDWQDDIVDPEDLEESVYEYVLNFRDGGEEHMKGLRKKCRMVESVVFTEEKLKAMGIPLGTVPLGWWIGFYVDDDDAWEKIKNGTYTQFSIEGSGQRKPVEDLDTRMKKSRYDEWLEENLDSDEETQKKMKEKLEKPVAKTFSQIKKFNPYHDRLGRFTNSGGATSFTYRPGKSKAHDRAIAREKKQSGENAISGGHTISSTGFTSGFNGKTYNLPKLKSKADEDNRSKALEELHAHFERRGIKNPNKEKYDEKMKEYLDQTDSNEWEKRANSRNKTNIYGNPIGLFIHAKGEATKKKEAAQNHDRELRSKAMDRAAMKRTKAHQKWADFDSEMSQKYGSDKYKKMTKEEGEKWDELRNARVFRNKRGQWQIAKTFSQLAKFKPYHDRSNTYRAPRKGWKGH